MSGITTMFWDVGGVVLSNGWDINSRRAACSKFGLDCRDFEAHHESVAEYLDLGRMSLDDYIEQTIFCHPRQFGKEEFKAFMFSQSQAHPDALAILERLAASGRYLIAALNNEARELNRYRIERFELQKYFSLFFSSCYLGARKPDANIYRMALDVTQRAGEECLMIDDREENLEAARRLGIETIRFENAKQLAGELERKLASAFRAA
jgi:putative hydrolase of the HAD superfamily